jgi:hypothetical protein
MSPLVALQAARLPPTQICSLYTILLHVSILCLRQKPTANHVTLKMGT